MAVKKKKRGRKAITWSPPKYDPGRIGEFIQQRYGTLPGWRQKQLYDRFKAQGAEFGEDPTGLRTDGLIGLTPEMRNRLPEGWGGEGAQNVGLSKPQYDETKFELGQSSTGRYFLRPRTELSGLGPAQVAAIREMDRRTQGQQALLRANYSVAGDTAARDAKNLAAQLAAIPGSGGTVSPASTSAATQAGVDDRSAETERTARTLQAQRASMEAIAQAPALRQMGETEASAYGASAQRARMEAIANFGSSNAQSAASEETLNARLRGQDLGLLGQQIRAGAQIGMNNADNATSIANTTQNNNRAVAVAKTNAQVQIARINSQLDIARQNNDTRRSIALLKEKSRILRDNDPAKIAERTVKQIQTSMPGANGNDAAVPFARQRKQFVQMMVAQGVPLAQARRLARIYIKG